MPFAGPVTGGTARMRAPWKAKPTLTVLSHAVFTRCQRPRLGSRLRPPRSGSTAAAARPFAIQRTPGARSRRIPVHCERPIFQKQRPLSIQSRALTGGFDAGGALGVRWESGARLSVDEDILDALAVAVPDSVSLRGGDALGRGEFEPVGGLFVGPSHATADRAPIAGSGARRWPTPRFR